LSIRALRTAARQRKIARPIVIFTLTSPRSPTFTYAVNVLIVFVRFPQADWILNADMFKDAMSSANVDVKKMPLGSLSQAQVIIPQKSNTAERSRVY
jgi:hypothetical protein